MCKHLVCRGKTHIEYENVMEYDELKNTDVKCKRKLRHEFSVPKPLRLRKEIEYRSEETENIVASKR